MTRSPIVDAPERALSPSQQRAYARLLEAVQTASLVMLDGPAGCGKTTLADRLIATCGGVRLGQADVLRSALGSATVAMDAPFLRLLREALEHHQLVVVSGFDELRFGLGAGRGPMWLAALQGVLDRARDGGRCVVLEGTAFHNVDGEESILPHLDTRRLHVTVPAFEAADFAFYLGLELDAQTLRSVSVDRLHQHAPTLNGHQLRMLGALLQHHGRCDEAFTRELVNSRLLQTNVRLDQVASVRFGDLKGMETLVEQLVTYVLNPLKGDPRLDGLGLLPKRGVLLYGPPGTGKTSIGRALAHQMEGKFFMLDGTVPSEPASEFYRAVARIFEAAKKAAPCVLFIDDADVLFQSGRAAGLTRYLLTMLDGLESATAGKVAVLMTAMDPNDLPPALLRSGRVELWLRTQPPAAKARDEIFATDIAALPPHLHEYSFEALARATDGFNAADMRRVVSDIKALYARDVIDSRAPRAADDYLALAAAGVRRNKQLLLLAADGALLPTPADDEEAAAADRPDAERSRREALSSCEGE